MKCNAWTLGLLGAGLVSLPAVMQAEETASSVMTALSSTTLSGYVDTSAQWNVGTGNQFTPAYAFGGPSKADGFNLNAVKLTLEKPIEATDSWGAGYKVDLFMGPDASTFNTLSAQSLAAGSADFAVKQAYVILRAPVGNGLDFKVGVWDTVIGYEVTESVNNPNFTRSYGYTIEPTTHTGALASYQFCDFFSASVGVANTFGPNINQRAFVVEPTKAESYKTYMAAATLTAPEDWGFLAGSTLTGGAINGFNAGVAGDETSWYVGTTLNTPVTGLKVGASYDYLGISDQPLRSSGYANATALYISYQLTEKMTVYGRGEYATSDTINLGAPKVVAATATLQYDLWKNVLSRLEFRWDHAASG
ncbi:MAG TPA: outer membrane beta-barrel protein, partial [Clostridia bacterium]|nr:outer membrane beta-barrel protein [Clostridia bacterium]